MINDETVDPMWYKELRDGSLVQGPEFSHPRLGMYSDGVVKITTHGIDALAQGGMKGHTPIELTEDWLLNELQFIKKTFYNRDYYFHTDGGVWALRPGAVDGKWDFCFQVRPREFYAFPVWIKYVHHVQNLFYSLYGYELPIKRWLTVAN